jgi:two-component system, sensor histidine kinase and response regulator
MSKILVIEDEDYVRNNVLELLEAEHFEVVSAENGLLGVHAAQEQLPDLIICDVMMPKLGGHEVLELLRKDPKTELIPFIFLTAKSEKTDVRQAMEQGADDYLTKPFTRAELLGAVHTRLEKQGMILKHSQQKLDNLRSGIAYALPHEMLTPLTSILGFSQTIMLQCNSLKRPKILEMVERIHDSGERLHRVIQNFLLYAELELAATSPEKIKLLRSNQTNSAKRVVTAVVSQKARQFKREADLVLTVEDSSIGISEINFNKMVDELVDNAFKHSPKGTPVHIISGTKDGKFMLSVTNQGRGMTAEQIANLGAYVQFERRVHEQQGSGLGLVIAMRLAELHGGNITIESKSIAKDITGKETLVRVTLPI